MRQSAAVIGVWLIVQLAFPSPSLAQPLGPGASERLRSFSTENNPSTLERIRDGLEPGSRDWVEATRRLADSHATTCFQSDEDDAPTCQQAATLYQEALDSGTATARLDELLYQYGLLRSWLGDGEGAVSLWQRLMTELPSSSLYPFTALALGEHYFSSAMLQPAREMVRIAAETPGFTGRYYALYLDSWCAVNLTEYAEALELLTQAVRAAERDMPQDEALRSQMLRDLPMFFAAGGNPAEALAFFSEVAPAEAGGLVEQTAALLREMGRTEDADVVQGLLP